MWEANHDRKGEGERINNSSGTFIPHPVFIFLSRYQVVAAVAVAAAVAVSVFSGHGGENDNNVATDGDGNGISHHDANDDTDDYQSHCWKSTSLKVRYLSPRYLNVSLTSSLFSQTEVMLSTLFGLNWILFMSMNLNAFPAPISVLNAECI